MPKQIKKVLFHQISLFVGLAMIVSFSSIFGAILLRQVLAAPAGTGSVLTGVQDIKGTGFVKDAHSLKQIRDKLDTVGGGGPGSWNCQVVFQSGDQWEGAVSCPSGFTLITGGCRYVNGDVKFRPYGNGWICTGGLPSAVNVEAHAWCCQ